MQTYNTIHSHCINSLKKVNPGINSLFYKQTRKRPYKNRLTPNKPLRLLLLILFGYGFSCYGWWVTEGGVWVKVLSLRDKWMLLLLESFFDLESDTVV